ncbi:MAG: pyridoxal-dependent decarboxylase [Xanthomonadales bacterium]|nr:pyridoxal-dependent decarboxylase [Xanthomonadales bacterium]
MQDRIKQLERACAILEPAASERRKFTAQAVGFADSFLERLPDMDTFELGHGKARQLDRPFTESPSALPDLLELLDSAILHEGINPASGGHLGYIPGGGVYPSALGDYLADVCNRYSGVAYASPGAARLEQSLVRWMAELVGFPPESGGDLTSGGSIANLSAVITARETMQIRARDIERSCIYLTEDAHHCIDKALRAAGLAECKKRTVAMDANFRMDVRKLENMILADRSMGLRPWLLIASAGTTDTGAVDPIETMADIAERYDLWLHIDAAYGGFFLLCEEGRDVLHGLQRAHSIVLDPHKGMFLPYGSGAVLVRDVNWLARAQAYEADYMQDAKAADEDFSPADLSLELSRPFRGLRFWLPVRLFGLAPFRAALAEKIWLARYFHEQLDKAAGWETGPYPELSVVTFRYVPEQGDVDAFNRRLLEAVHADGKVFISSTMIEGKFILRLAVLHFRSHLAQVDYLLGLLKRLVRELA